MLVPGGPRAAAIADIWWAMFWGGLIIQALLVGLAVYVLWWRGRRPHVRGSMFVIGGGLLLPVTVLTALLLYGFRFGALLSAPVATDLEIEIVGRQFWWEIRYPGEPPVAVPGVLRIPVGEPVALALRSEDVIHSFWVPSLAGKLDLIPGRINTTWLQADRPGVYRGQCAEFCGAQHARMTLIVVAESRAEFDAWLARQRAPATLPTVLPAQTGRELYAHQGCQNCHHIRDGMAIEDGKVDLTDTADRWQLRAAYAPVSAASLADWIRASHLTLSDNRLPPGVAALTEPEREAIAAYLEALR